MIKYFKSFVLMITFLTRIPIPVNFEFSTEDFTRGNRFFPIIGGLIGLLLLPTLFLHHLVSHEVLAFIIIIWYLLIVGGLHIDGIGDLFDGIFSARDQKRMFAIMEDSHVGAFGVIGLILYFLGMFVGLCEIQDSEQVWLILFFMPIIGRTSGLISAGVSKYAKENGMGKAIVDSVTPTMSGLYLIFLIILGFFLQMLVPVLITMGLSAIILWRINHILDGITGDVVGAMVEMSQVIFLIGAGTLL